MGRVVRITRQTLDRCVSRDEKIRACQGVYSASTTGTYFGLTRKRVYEIWNAGGDIFSEPPNIQTDIRKPRDLYDDGIILLGRGICVQEAAKQLGTSSERLRIALRIGPTGRELLERDREASKDWKAGRDDPQGSYGYGIDYPCHY